MSCIDVNPATVAVVMYGCAFINGIALGVAIYDRSWWRIPLYAFLTGLSILAA